MRANIPDKRYFLDRPLPSRPDITIIEWVDGGSNAHLFKAYSESLLRNLACKIIPRSNLSYGSDGSDLWREEVKKADVLRNSSVVKFEAIEEWTDDKLNIDCVVLIAEFVEGPCLKKFINENARLVDVPFIIHWLETMLNLFYEMERQNVKHGDLHLGNILVEDRSSYNLMGSRYVFRVTDFGVADATSTAWFKDDYQQLANLLRQLLSCVNYSQSTQKDKYIFRVLRDHFLARHLVETDLTRDPLARRPR